MHVSHGNKAWPGLSNWLSCLDLDLDLDHPALQLAILAYAALFQVALSYLPTYLGAHQSRQEAIIHRSSFVTRNYYNVFPLEQLWLGHQ